MCFGSEGFSFYFFFFNDTATTEIYTLSLHDALPISWCGPWPWPARGGRSPSWGRSKRTWDRSGRCPTSTDRKSTRLNSSHLVISYAVFCLKKKNMARKKLTIIYVCRSKVLVHPTVLL